MADRKHEGRELELNFGYSNEDPNGYQQPPHPQDGMGEPPLTAEPFQFDIDRMDDGGHRKRRWGPLIVLVLGIVAGGVAAWTLLGGDTSMDSPNQIPTVRADSSPVKVRPDDPGGMDVPNRDKLVYERMGGHEQAAPGTDAERLLPPPENPRMPSAPTVTTPTAPPPVATTKPPAVQEALLPTTTTPAPESTKPVAPPAVQQQAPVQEKPAATTPPPVATAPAATPAKGSYVIQLASVASKADADKEWGRLRRTHADLLGTLTLDVQKADLGAKGVFFRVRGGMIDEASARQLCAELSKRKVGCIVAKK